LVLTDVSDVSVDAELPLNWSSVLELDDDSVEESLCDVRLVSDVSVVVLDGLLMLVLDIESLNSNSVLSDEVDEVELVVSDVSELVLDSVSCVLLDELVYVESDEVPSLV
jgi:hypothetical protein